MLCAGSSVCEDDTGLWKPSSSLFRCYLPEAALLRAAFGFFFFMLSLLSEVWLRYNKCIELKYTVSRSFDKCTLIEIGHFHHFNFLVSPATRILSFSPSTKPSPDTDNQCSDFSHPQVGYASSGTLYWWNHAVCFLCSALWLIHVNL